MNLPEANDDLLRDATAWVAITAGRAELRLSGEQLRGQPALRFDFDFRDAGGFVVARREVRRQLPESYRVRLRLRAEGAVNDLELKFSDAHKRHVRRRVLKRATRGSRWRTIEISGEEIEYAWGESGGGVLRELGVIEFAIVAGDGGKGSVWIKDLQIIDSPAAAAVLCSASSQTEGHHADQALDTAGWQPRADDAAPWLQLDVSHEQRYGGLIIDWRERAPPQGFRLRSSSDGHRWQTLYATATAGGTRSYVPLPDARLRFLRLELDQAGAGAQLRLQPPGFSRSAEEFWHQLAAGEPRGHHPRWLQREQCLWTPVGTSGGAPHALLDEDGRVEFAIGSAMLEPLLRIGDRLYTWADVSISRELREHWMPTPSVIWDGPSWSLRITAEATARGALRLRYSLHNRGTTDLDAELFVLLRPFQVTPPWQKFESLGGIRTLQRLHFDGHWLEIDDSAVVAVLDRPARFHAQAFAHGSLVAAIADDTLCSQQTLDDPSGYGSGVLRVMLSAKANADDSVSLSAARTREALAGLDEAAFDWPAIFGERYWSGASDAAAAIDSGYTAGAHILLTRDRAALQPGARRYTRSWIRDATIMAGALLRLNRVAEVGDFIRWYAPFVRADGFVPCCVDRHGADPLVEHDSHGQWLALIADYFHYSCDAALLDELWPQIERTVACIARLIEPAGLLPISASHEGYLAQPVHSYWDDFWALRGLRDAADLARQRGRADLQAQWCALEVQLADALFASIEDTRRTHGLDFIPASVEWADFDPSATASAITLLNLPPELDRTAVETTFRRYLDSWRRRCRADDASRNYSPYEIRIIGALVRLGWRTEALEVLRYFLKDRRPDGWNQWPEIAWHDPHAPAHIGDIPHTWIGAEYVLVLRSLFAYESHPLHAQVLAAGLAPEWLDGDGVRVQAMPTRHGPLSYTLRRETDGTLHFTLQPGIATPILLKAPMAATPHVIECGDADIHLEGDGIRIAAIRSPLQLCIRF